MRVSKGFSRVPALASRRPKTCGGGAAAILVTILAPVAVAQSVQPPTTALFAVYSDDQGSLTTNSTDPSTLNAKNPFFDPSIGTNGQACVTCHEPFTGITITPPFINQAFVSSGGTDPLFRLNDTANNPFGTITPDNPDNFSLIKGLGVVRIGKPLPTGANAPNFTVVADNALTNEIFAAPETFPLTGDPQHPGVPSLSVFRRPLINVNVNFDSAVLWDGRADIEALGGVNTPPNQVQGAIKTLLLGAGTDATVNNSIADFMTGVYTDQKASNVSGELTALGATGGVANMIALSESPNRPCVFDPAGNLTSFVLAVATATSCEPVVVGGEIVGGPPTFTLFDSWASLPNNPGNADRLSVARGQAVFNKTGCVFCHTVPNLGNNASAGAPGFKRDGTESPSILNAVLAAATTPQEAAMVQDMINRNNELPLYCLRPTSDHSGTACGSDAADVVTTDPGRALVTGHIADAGLFKPPILRSLGVRPPFFHAGAAADSPNGTAMQHLVNFYNLRFGFGLTAAQQADLVNFLNAL